MTNVKLSPSSDDLISLTEKIGDNLLHIFRPGRSLSLRDNGSEVFVDIGSIQDSETVTVRQLAEEMERKLKNDPQRLIIDIRQNGGGNNFLNQPLIHAIIANKRINYPGKLFVFIDRWTFSAAVNLAKQLQNETWALFVGEPYSARVNHYGDSKKVILPNSGLLVRISTLYWQDSEPADKRMSIMPDIPVQYNFKDFIEGIDPYITAIHNYKVPEDFHRYHKKYTPRYFKFRESQKSKTTHWLLSNRD